MGLVGCKYIFDLMFNWYHIFQSSSSILNSHQQYMSSGSSISSLTFGVGSLFNFSRSSECVSSVQFISVQSLSRVWLFATPWTEARQASLSITNSQSPPKQMSVESVMPSNHLIRCRPLLLPSIFPSIRVFSNELALRIRWPKYWTFGFNVSPSNDHPELISFRMDWLDLFVVQGMLKSSPTPQFKSINSSVLSFLCSPALTSIHDHWKNHSLN